MNLQGGNGGFFKKYQLEITGLIIIVALVALGLSIAAFATKCKSGFEGFGLGGSEGSQYGGGGTYDGGDTHERQISSNACGGGASAASAKNGPRLGGTKSETWGKSCGENCVCWQGYCGLKNDAGWWVPDDNKCPRPCGQISGLQPNNVGDNCQGASQASFEKCCNAKYISEGARFRSTTTTRLYR